MHPRTKITQRNASELESYESLLIYGPPELDDLSYLSPSKVVTVDYRVFNSLSHLKEGSLQFGLAPLEEKNYDAALVYIPKAKVELEMALEFVCSHLTEGGDIFLVGEKKAGIASGAKKLSLYSDDASKIDSAAHCQLWQASLNKDVSFDLDTWFDQYSVQVGDISLNIASIPGVFSHGELDQATDILIQNMFYKLSGRVLDFGCGSGVLGCYTKLLNPSIDLEMIDISWLALECSKRTAALNNIDANVYASDGWAGVKGRVQGVVTNPPFHQGVDTEYSTTEGFIRQSKDKMARHAPFLLVANNFLRYSPIIESTLGRCDIHAENSKFRVYKAYR